MGSHRTWTIVTFTCLTLSGTMTLVGTWWWALAGMSTQVGSAVAVTVGTMLVTAGFSAMYADVKGGYRD